MKRGRTNRKKGWKGKRSLDDDVIRLVGILVVVGEPVGAVGDDGEAGERTGAGELDADLDGGDFPSQGILEGGRLPLVAAKRVFVDGFGGVEGALGPVGAGAAEAVG